MTRGAWMCRQQDDGLNIWCAPRERHEKPSAEPERGQKWRLSLASALLLSALLCERLWPCAADMPRHNSTSARPWRPGTCHPDSLSKSCFTFDSAHPVCGRWADVNLSDLYLSFCDSYSLLDLFYGLPAPDRLNCTLKALGAGACARCVDAYLSYDRHAQERYEEFELLAHKYETDVYSVRTCMDECKAAYKLWLCSQYFQITQMHCSNRIPCKQYCLEVQKNCPFVLPDNDDLIHGGSPSFICTGLLESSPSGPDTECCDVRWEYRPSNRSRGSFRRTHPSCQHRTSLSSSAAGRLCNTRLKLCLLVLLLLQSVVSLSAAHNSTALADHEE